MIHGNIHMVAAQGSLIRVMRPPTGPISAEEALELAAWLVAIAKMHSLTNFEDVLEEVQST